MNPIRVLVVEDSLTVRRRLVEVISSDPDLRVVGEAGDGKTAIELCRELRPDMITLDMQLPVLSGLAVTEYVMAYCPTPILIVSSSTNRGDLYKTYDALAAGAVDVLEKPKGDEGEGVWERKFLGSIRLISKIRVITHMRGRLRDPAVQVWVSKIPDAGPYRVVAIGASTGGPAAVAEILRRLPADFPLPILLVIHIGEAFGALLAEWLDSQSQLRVACALDGEELPEIGKVMVAAPGKHLVLSGGRVRLTHAAERNSCRPSVDVLFESVAREIGARAVACQLTGMGRDGAEGLLAIRQAGGRTIAQDELSSNIFGMPQEAIRIGAAERVLGLRDIPAALITLASAGRNRVPGTTVSR